MADYFPTTDANSVKIWETQLQAAVLAKTIMKPYIGGNSAIISERSAKGRKKGDTVYYNLRAPIDGEGKVGSETLEGFEEDLTIHQASMVINLSRHAVFVGDEISEERYPWDDLREEAKDAISEWGARRLEQAIMNHACGFTPANALHVTRRGHNTVVAPTSSTRILRASSASTDEGLGSGDKFTLQLIDFARERAFKEESSAFRIEPGDGRKYVCILSPEQLTDLRDDDRWEAIQRAALARSASNPLYEFAAGEYNDTIFVPSQWVTQGVNSSTGAAVADTRRAVFLGQNALSIAWGRQYGGGAWKWVESMRDYDDKRYVAAKLLWGVKKDVFNSTDRGCIVISTYAKAHA